MSQSRASTGTLLDTVQSARYRTDMEKKAVLVRMDPEMTRTLDLMAAKSRDLGSNDSRASLIRLAVNFWLAANQRDNWPTMPFMRERRPDLQKQITSHLASGKPPDIPIRGAGARSIATRT